MLPPGQLILPPEELVCRMGDLETRAAHSWEFREAILSEAFVRVGWLRRLMQVKSSFRSMFVRRRSWFTCEIRIYTI
jgi:hypothetical protein